MTKLPKLLISSRGIFTDKWWGMYMGCTILLLVWKQKSDTKNPEIKHKVSTKEGGVERRKCQWQLIRCKKPNKSYIETLHTLYSISYHIIHIINRRHQQHNYRYILFIIIINIIPIIIIHMVVRVRYLRYKQRDGFRTNVDCNSSHRVPEFVKNRNLLRVMSRASLQFEKDW